MRRRPAAVVMALSLLAGTGLASESPGSFRPGELWKDDQGVHINAHGGGVLDFEGRYYWFVMWFHLELKGSGYSSARSGVAVADRVTGPFTFQRSFRPNSGTWPRNIRPERKAPRADPWRHQYSGGDLPDDADRLNLVARDYYLIASGCTGWAPNAARAAVADSIWGPWTELGNPAVGPGAELTFQSQSTFVLPVRDRPGAFVFMADQWRPENPIDGRYVWLPVLFRNDRIEIEWTDEWDLGVFGAFALPE